MDWWDEKLREEGQKLCRQHGFTTGFLEGGGTHSLVDSYELKVTFKLIRLYFLVINLYVYHSSSWNLIIRVIGLIMWWCLVLQVRLEHILERMTMISIGSDTERPSCVLPHLYIGGALAAR